MILSSVVCEKKEKHSPWEAKDIIYLLTDSMIKYLENYQYFIHEITDVFSKVAVHEILIRNEYRSSVPIINFREK